MLGMVAKQLAALLVPILVAAIGDEIKKHIPTIVHAVVAAVTETLTTATASGVDKITDVIPGQLDDKFVDPIVRSVLDKLQGLL